MLSMIMVLSICRYSHAIYLWWQTHIRGARLQRGNSSHTHHKIVENSEIGSDALSAWYSKWYVPTAFALYALEALI